MKVGKMLKSFKFAFEGLYYLLKNENNARFHLLAALLVIFAGWFYILSLNEWLIIIITIALVIAAEAINTALEKLCDLVMPEKNEKVKVIKDISAAAVLLIAMAAVLVAAIIFFPKI